jgi:predicted GNAT family N-acyltransferase
MTALAPRGSPPLSGLEIRFARSDAEMAAIHEIRRRVFGDEQGIPGSSDKDQDDWHSMHVLATIPEGAIGTGRLTLPDAERAYALIAWIATLPGYRRRGVGVSIMRLLLDTADQLEVETTLLSAQTHALHFYRRLGFTPYGERFFAAGIEHQFMYRHHPRRS